MSAALRMRVGVGTAGLCCLLAGLALAQQRQQVLDQPQIGQPDRQATQAGETGQPRTAQFRGTQTTGAGLNEKVEHYVANCLLIKNKAEIEISQFAQQQAQDPQVKQFAQKLVQDHQQIVQKLQALPTVQANARGQSDAQRPATDRNRSANQAGDESEAVNQLLQMDRQITQQANEMLREELQSKSGSEFDKCFLNAQVGQHMHMLAALEVIGQKAQGELGQIVQQAKPNVQQHLEQAKQLLQATEGSGQPRARAQRQTERTQR